jgi:predicted nucleic acid-binding protein
LIVAVIDSNVIVSSAVSIRTPPEQIVTAWVDGAFELAISRPMIDEVERPLGEPYFVRKAGPARIEAVLERLRSNATTVEPILGISGIATHPAVAAGAGYLVTGDRQLQRLGVLP